MLRMNQKIKRTRTELQKFAEYDGLECGRLEVSA